MTKKSNPPDDAATSDTLPPPSAAPDIVIDDSPEGLVRLREAGFTFTQDIHPGVILCGNGNHIERAYNGDTVRWIDGGILITRRAPNA